MENFTIVNETVLKSVFSGYYHFDVPEFVTSLGPYCFNDCRVTIQSVTFLGTNLVSIGIYCFSYCQKLKSLDFHQCPNLKTIDGFAFCYTGLESLYFPPNCPVSYGGYQSSLISAFEIDINHTTLIEVDEVIYNKDKNILYAYPPNKNGEIFTIPSGITIIDSLAFSTAKHIKYISFPKELNTISVYAFAYTGLIEAILPDSIANIDVNVFEGCSELRSVQIHCQLSSIPSRFFYKCTKLTNIFIAGNPKISLNAFEGCTSLCNVYASESVKNEILKLNTCIKTIITTTKHCNKLNFFLELFNLFLMFTNCND